MPGRVWQCASFPLQTGYADYLLFVDERAVGVIEAKATGIPLAGVAEQASSYYVLDQPRPNSDGDRLRQAILKRAFEGRLITQRPEDELVVVQSEGGSAGKKANDNSGKPGFLKPGETPLRK